MTNFQTPGMFKLRVHDSNKSIEYLEISNSIFQTSWISEYSKILEEKMVGISLLVNQSDILSVLEKIPLFPLSRSLTISADMVTPSAVAV